MKIHSVYDPEFKPYGKVLEGYDTAELSAAMEAIALPEEGVAYEPGIDSLEACALFAELRDRAYGGMPIQLGMCWGRNTKLNCLEYHRDSEINIGWKDFILLLAKQEEIEDGVLDTAKPDYTPASKEDKWMTARNKWLLAHPESAEAKNGAHVGLTGVNIDIKEDL